MINELFERELQNTSINNISLADYIKENYVSKKSGKWILTADADGARYFRCSDCGSQAPLIWDKNGHGYISDKEINFCPNCGADMRGAK